MTQTTERVRSGGSGGSPRKGGPLHRIGVFYRQVVAELRKVIWPTRRELITYTVVSIFFVAVMIAIVAGLDVAFTKAVIALFG